MLSVLFALLTISVSGQSLTNCTNTYTTRESLCPTNPNCCPDTGGTVTNCTVNNLTALSLANTSTGEYYLLCIQLTEDLYLTNLSDELNGGLGVSCPDIYLSNSNLTLVVPQDQNNISLLAAQNTLSFQQLTNVSCDYLLLSASILTVGGSSEIYSFAQLNVTVNVSLTVTNSKLLTVELLAISNGTVTINNSTIDIQEVALMVASGTFTLANTSSIYSLLNVCDYSACSCSGEGTENCTQGPPLSFPLAWNATNFQLPTTNASLGEMLMAFDISILANTLVINSNSSVQASGVGIYTNTTHIANQSNVSAQGLGCRSKTGLGCGYYDLTLNQLLACSGTGGSYGGLGGSSAPDTCTLLAPRRSYGSLVFPTNKGSGGGNPLTNSLSAGGGLIVVQTYMLSIDTNSEINVDGAGGLFGGGGGSGGSINIQTAFVAGGGQLSAEGGFGKSSGGGGRISLQLMLWANSTISQPSSSLILQVNPGGTNASSLSSGLNGSIFTTPCLPGQQLTLQYLCQSCPGGTFKPSFGYSGCINCSQPPNSFYGNPFQKPNMLSSCLNYSCQQSTPMSYDRIHYQQRRIV